MRNLSVVNVNVKGMIGYQIQGIHRACSDSLWETVAHAAIFRDKARAESYTISIGSTGVYLKVHMLVLLMHTRIT